MDGAQLARSFNRNLSVIRMQVDGLTHPDSLLQLPFRGNCLNWTLGHLVVNRDDVLELLGEQRLFTQDETQRYDYESEPVLGDGPEIVAMEAMLVMLRDAQEMFDDLMPGMPAEAFKREIQSGDRMVTIAKRMSFLCWHETYHTGQTEILRQLAGTDDKVI